MEKKYLNTKDALQPENGVHRHKKYLNIVFILLFWILLSGHSVIVQWNRNQEKDVAGYRVYWGTESRNYSHWKAAGADTICPIENLSPGGYFFAVTAYDTAGNESKFSQEVYFEIRNQPDTEPGSGDDGRAYNFPNPFNPDKERTVIRYVLPQTSKVSIDIYDVNDELVRQLLPLTRKPAGEHTEDVWDGKNEQGAVASNGVYFAVIRYDFIVKVVTIAVVR
ncbi:MAG: hypothetical protein GXO74_00090 [Calditrichaeota bacterium]|nr:hypothetical protein [Calditrichota bacterium]